MQRCSVARPLTRSGEATRVQTAVATEFFVDPTGNSYEVRSIFFRYGGNRKLTSCAVVDWSTTLIHRQVSKGACSCTRARPVQNASTVREPFPCPFLLDFRFDFVFSLLSFAAGWFILLCCTPHPDPSLNGVCLDRFSVDFGFASAGGQETITLTNNSDTQVQIYPLLCKTFFFVHSKRTSQTY